MAEFEMPTDAQFEEMSRVHSGRPKARLLAVSARYDGRGGRVMITLQSGAVVGFPSASLPGLESATAQDMRHIVVEGGGYGLHFPSLDADISVPQLLADQLGSSEVQRAVARAQASRVNGKLGGRPRKPVAA